MSEGALQVETPSSPPSRRHQIAVIIPLGFRSSTANNDSETNGTSTPPRPRALLLVIMSEDSFNDTNNSEEDSFQNLLNRFFQSYQPRGTPPASQKIIERLPPVIIDDQVKAEAIRCTVCMEDFEVGDEQICVKLPCAHVLHKDCVTPWLKEHNTCPVCRYELPVEDEAYEKERKERMATRSNVDEDSFFHATNTEENVQEGDSLPPLVNQDTVEEVEGDTIEQTPTTINEPAEELSLPNLNLEWLLERIQQHAQEQEQQQPPQPQPQPQPIQRPIPVAAPPRPPRQNQGFFARKWNWLKKKVMKAVPCNGARH